MTSRQMNEQNGRYVKTASTRNTPTDSRISQWSKSRLNRLNGFK